LITITYLCYLEFGFVDGKFFIIFFYFFVFIFYEKKNPWWRWAGLRALSLLFTAVAMSTTVLGAHFLLTLMFAQDASGSTLDRPRPHL